MTLNIKGQLLKIEDGTVAEGALNYATFKLICDKKWKKLNKTVRFKHVEDYEIYDLTDVKDNRVLYLPDEVLKKGKVEVSVIGVKGESTVATTSISEITVMASLDSGNTPRVKNDAYAKYVDSVASVKKSCEKAEKITLEAKKEILKAREECRSFFEGAKIALAESKEILQEVSGAVDAIGIVMRDIKNEERKLLDFDFFLNQNEEKRRLFEKERIMKEAIRDKAEARRQEREKDREILEAGRISSEKARGLFDIKREEQIKDILSRLECLEKRRDSYTEELDFQENFESSDEVIKARLIVNKDMTQSPITLKINGRDEEINILAPLRKMGDVFDEIVLEKESTYLLRRLHTVTFNGSEEIVEGDKSDDYSLYLTELPYPAIELVESNCFAVGREKGECLWVSGSYLFFKLDKKSYPTKSHLSSYLATLEAPLKITYVLENQIKEELNFPPKEIVSLSIPEFTVKATLSKNVISTLTKLLKKIGE